MAKQKSNELNEISKFVIEGRFDLAKKKIKTTLRNYYKYPEKSQLFLISMLINLGQSSKVISLIGPELTKAELQNANIYVLASQAILAKIKAQNESVDSALRITRAITEVVKMKSGFPDEDLAFVLDLLSANYLYCLAYNEVFQLENLYPASMKEGNLNYFFFNSSLIEAKIYSKGSISEEEIQALEKEKEKLNSPLEKIHWDFFIYFLRFSFDKITDPRSFLSQLSNVIKEAPQFDYWFHFLSAKCHQLLGELEEAKVFFQKSLEKASSTQERLASIYSLEQLQPELVPLEQKIFLRCLPSTSGYCFLAGNRFRANAPYFLPFYKNKIDQAESQNIQNHHWLINQNEIKLDLYNRLQPERTTLDLSAGMILFENGDIIHLTDARIKCLMTLIGGSTYGIHELFLIDQVYPEHRFDQANAELRAKNLLMQLKKLGIVIKQKKKHYFYCFKENHYDIIFPASHKSQGAILYCSKKMECLTQKTLAQLLKIKDSTASLYIHDWREKNLIERRESAPYGTWFIK